MLQYAYAGEPVVTLKINSEEEMVELESRAEASGLVAYIVHDAGRTQV